MGDKLTGLNADVKDHNNINSVCKQIMLLILEGLHTFPVLPLATMFTEVFTGRIKNNKKLDMDYMNYKINIIHKLGVELAGWPSKIPMARPAKLTADQAHEIHKG